MAIKFPKSEKYNFTRNLVKRYKLVDHLDRYFGDEVEEFQFIYEPKKKDDAWHPSGHCTPPPSVLYDIATGNVEHKEWGSKMLRTFMVGHFWHQLLQKAVVDLGLAEESAIERQGVRTWGDPMTRAPYHWATGAGDVAPCSLPGHGDYIIDFKTMSSFQFKPNKVPDWAANKYEAQINIYMDFFDLEHGLIVAINKDDSEMKEFEYVRNQPLVDAIYDKWKFVSECLEIEHRPEAEDDAMFDYIDELFTGPIAQ